MLTTVSLGFQIGYVGHLPFVAREFPVEELYRVAPILTVTEGTPEMQQLTIGCGPLGESAF